MAAASYVWLVVIATALLVAATDGVEDYFLFDTFPENFKWGAASAAYQAEGGWDADGKGESIWDRFSHTPGNMLENATGDVACDSYNLYKTDIQLLKDLGVHFYRFSVAWSRVIPSGKLAGGINEAGVAYYNNIINSLLAVGIEPVVTIYHWDLPQRLQDEYGGWVSAEVIPHFHDFAILCFQRFGDRVKRWITFNEPYVHSWFGYGLGLFAPGVKSPSTGIYLVTHNILKAHALAWHTYDDVFRRWQGGKVSMTLFSEWKEPYDVNNPSDVAAAERAVQFNIGWFAHPIYVNGDYPEVMKRTIADKSRAEGLRVSRLPVFTEEEKRFINQTFDFFGLNHYATKLVRSTTQGVFYNLDAGVEEISDTRWKPTGTIFNPIVPWGIRKELDFIRRNYGNPEVYITENGYSDTEQVFGDLNDVERIDFIQGYTNNVLKAIRLDGCNVGAYTYWSLLDSLEWSVGYTLKFGLYKVDFNDPRRRRTAKASAAFFADLIKDNGWKCPARNPYLSRVNSCPPERLPLPVPTPSDYEQIYNHREGCWRRRTNTRRCRVIGLQTTVKMWLDLDTVMFE